VTFESSIKLAGRCLCGMVREWADRNPEDHRSCRGLPELRKCDACKRVKPEDEFYRHCGRLRRQCKDCIKSEARGRYWMNPEREAARHSAYYRRTAPVRIAKAKAYNEAHREEVRERRRRYRRDNRDRLSAEAVDRRRRRMARLDEAKRGKEAA
jgi:hypothetical protein